MASTKTCPHCNDRGQMHGTFCDCNAGYDLESLEAALSEDEWFYYSFRDNCGFFSDIYNGINSHEKYWDDIRLDEARMASFKAEVLSV